jgi:hydroxymethylbilane synthase
MTAPRPLIIGTRGSALALWQAHHIAERLLALGQPTELRIIKTSGDRIQDLAFDKMEGKGFFTKELEAELLAGTIDLAVHSCKDLETNEPAGLTIAAYPGRAACTELLLLRPEAMDHTRALELKLSATVGTSSARRKAQLKQLRPDVRIQDLRGNVPTRVEKLRSGRYDAILLAKAGLDRLGLDLGGLHVLELDPRVFVPAPAQGALAIQTRREDAITRAVVEQLNEPFASRTSVLERRVLNAFHGGCQVPLGVHVQHTEGRYELWASGTRAWGDMPRRVQLQGTDTDQLAREAVRRLSAPMKPLRVVITRALEGNELIARTLHAHGITLGGMELLAPIAVPFTEIPDHDRLFFTSPNAVRFFVQGGGDLSMAPCDAIGNGTADEIRVHGGQAVFIGDGPDTPTIAKAYVERFGQVRVLFPCATEGLGTVQKVMPEGHAIDLHVYAMRPVSFLRPIEGDVVIVTSPNHADALHTIAPLHSWRHVVAMGTSTAARIKALSGADAMIPWSSTQMALIDAIFHLATDPANT